MEGHNDMPVNGNSAYAQAMNAAGKTMFGCTTDNELVEMIEALAKRDGVKYQVWLRTNWAATVNAAGLKRPDGSPWVYVPKDATTALTAAQQKIADLEAKLAALEAKDEKIEDKLVNGLEAMLEEGKDSDDELLEDEDEDEEVK